MTRYLLTGGELRRFVNAWTVGRTKLRASRKPFPRSLRPSRQVAPEVLKDNVKYNLILSN